MLDTMSILETDETLTIESCLPYVGEPSVLGLAEKLLKARSQVDELLRDQSRQADLIPRFLMIALASSSSLTQRPW